MSERSTEIQGPALRVTGLELAVRRPGGLVPVVTGVDLAIERGELVGLVGESGSGKTLTALAVAGLLPAAIEVTGGRIEVDGRECHGRRGQRPVDRGLAMIFQNPMTSLNPSMRVGKQVSEAVRRHREGLSRKAAHAAAVELLERVELREPPRTARKYPHELSGGMRQRIMIAIALACNPKVLIADEPTTALDVTVQRGVMDLLEGLRKELGLAILLISHDLALMGERCDRLQVMYAGELVECGPTAAVLTRPAHPYVSGLLSCSPERVATIADLHALPGRVPRPGEVDRGCRFVPRCAVRLAECETDTPELYAIGSDRQARCHLVSPVQGSGLAMAPGLDEEALR